MTESYTPELAEFLASTSASDVPLDVVERTRFLLLDGIACGLVAAKLPWSVKAVEGTLAVDGDGPSALWGWDRRVTPMSAALLNGTFVQGFELDDFHPHGALHSSAVVVPAAVAAVEASGRRVSFDDFLAALAMGYEVGPRVGIALGGAAATVRGWHSGAVFGPFGAAAAAGKVFDLDGPGFESAFGNAGTRAGALMAAQYKSMVKRMHHGMASQAGLHGASLANAGFLGTERIIEHEYGGVASTMFLPDDSRDLSLLLKGLGEYAPLMNIGIKRHACLIMLHSAVDALLAYRCEPGYSLADIVRIRIEVSESVFRRTSWRMERPGSSLGAQMNLHFAAAAALIDGAVYVEQFTDESLQRKEVWELMDRIEVVHSDEIDALGRDRRFVSYIDITDVHGDVTRLTGTPPQDRGFRADDVVRKYRALLDGVIPIDRIESIEALVLEGGEDSTVDELIALLAAPANPVLGGGT